MPDEAPSTAPPAPDDPATRIAQRIVRGGVLALIGGFLTTFGGAVLLGNGPSEWETIGNVVHRGGMFLMLGGLAVVIFGYRWPSIDAFLAATPEPTPADAARVGGAGPRDIHELLDSLPPPPANTEHPTSPLSFLTPSAPMSQPPLSNSPLSNSPGTVPPPPPPPASRQVGCLVIGWCATAFVLLFAAIPYCLGSPRDVVILSYVFDLFLLVALTIWALESSGRRRAYVVGALVPLALMELVKTMRFFDIASPSMYAGPYGNPYGLRIFDVAMHATLVGFALFGAFVHATLEFSRRRRSPDPRS